MKLLLARTVNRIGVETLWVEDGRFYARLDNRTYHAEHEIPYLSAMRRLNAMRSGRGHGATTGSTPQWR